eukprot:66912-Hanusia_phi.AAC.1
MRLELAKVELVLLAIYKLEVVEVVAQEEPICLALLVVVEVVLVHIIIHLVLDREIPDFLPPGDLDCFRRGVHGGREK